MRRSARALLLAVAVIAAGCGGDEKDTTTGASTTPSATASTDAAPAGGGAPTPADAVRGYFKAIAGHDAARACNLLSTKVQRQAVASARIPGGAAKDCARALEKIVAGVRERDLRRLRDVKISKSAVSGDTATVRPSGTTREAQLTQIGGRWFITGGLYD
ncbi:MAG: hypothetical protein ACRDKY_12445 [Solirubrobacteraceae bacterium]